MWPRLIAQLLELLPHVSRLVPMADSYFASRASGDRAHVVATNSLGDTVRSDIATLSDSTAALSSRLTQNIAEQAARITTLQHSLEQAEAENIRINRQLEWLSKDVNSLRIWVKFGTSAILLCVATTLALIARLYVSH